MDGQGNPDVAALVRAAARSPVQRARMLGILYPRCWPGGSDRSEPAGRRWLRAWGPSRAAAPLPACGCADGRCSVCN